MLVTLPGRLTVTPKPARKRAQKPARAPRPHRAMRPTNPAPAAPVAPAQTPAPAKPRELSPREVLVRSEHRAYLEDLYMAAEEDCGGQLVNTAGQARGITGWELVTGDPRRVGKWGTRELQDWMSARGRRYTLTDFRRMMGAGAERGAEMLVG